MGIGHRIHFIPIIVFDIVISLILMMCLIVTFLINLFKYRTKPTKRSKVVLCLSKEGKSSIPERGFQHLLSFHNDYLEKVIFVNLMAKKNMTAEVTQKLIFIAINRPKLATIFKNAGLIISSTIYSFIIYILILCKLAQKEQVGIIRSIEPNIMGFLSVLLKYILGVKFIQDIRGNYDLIYKNAGMTLFSTAIQSQNKLLTKLSYALEKRLRWVVYTQTDLIFGGNENNLKHALENGANPRKARLVRVNIDPAIFDLSNLRDVRKELKLNNNYKLLTFVGRFEPEKYPEDVIIAFSEVVKSREDVKLIMVGDGSLRKELKELVKKLELSEKAIFLGYMPNDYVRNILYSSDVILVPLGGSVLIEAALSSKPIVAYDYEWHSELIIDGKTGILVGFRDCKGMAKAILKLLDDSSLSAELGQNARELAIKMFHPDVIRENEARCYRELFEGK